MALWNWHNRTASPSFWFGCSMATTTFPNQPTDHVTDIFTGARGPRSLSYGSQGTQAVLCMQFCKAKIELDDDDHQFGTCSKCSAYIQTKRCTATRFAKLVLTTPSLEVTTLVAYNRLLDASIREKPLHSP